MTRAASDKPIKVMKPVDTWEPPTALDINLDKHPHMDGKHNVGDTMHFHGKGKVVSISKGKDHSSVRVEVSTIKKLASNLKKNGPYDHGDAEEAGEGSSDDESGE